MPAAVVPVWPPPQPFRGLHRRLAAPFVAGLAGGPNIGPSSTVARPGTVNGTSLNGAPTLDDRGAGLERRTELAPGGAQPELKE